MAVKIFNVRLQNKYCTYQELTDANPVLLAGETCYVSIPEGSGIVPQEPAVLQKIGDGSTPWNELPFVSALGFQSDWAVNDENDAAYVKNRTHYESVTETEIVDINQRMTEIGNVWVVDESTIAYYGVCSIPLDSYDFNTNTGYGVVVNGINNKGQLTEVDFSPFGRTFIFGDWDGITSGESNAFALRLEERPDENIWSIEAFSVTDTPPTECRLLICEEQVVKLDKKFIPDEAFAQADWAETDETNVSFIKNKPAETTDEEFFSMMVEADMIAAVQDTDDSILTDENGNILEW